VFKSECNFSSNKDRYDGIQGKHCWNKIKQDSYNILTSLWFEIFVNDTVTSTARDSDQNYSRVLVRTTPFALSLTYKDANAELKLKKKKW
jgi:hypothetical protein